MEHGPALDAGAEMCPRADIIREMSEGDLGYLEKCPSHDGTLTVRQIAYRVKPFWLER